MSVVCSCSRVWSHWLSVHSDTTRCLASTTSTTAGSIRGPRTMTQSVPVRRPAPLVVAAAVVDAAAASGACTSAWTGTAKCGRLGWGRRSGGHGRTTTTTTKGRWISTYLGASCSSSASSTRDRRRRPCSRSVASPSCRPAGPRPRRPTQPFRRTATGDGNGNGDVVWGAVACYVSAVRAVTDRRTVRDRLSRQRMRR